MTEKLEMTMETSLNRKEKIKNLIQETVQTLPGIMRTVAELNLSSVYLYIEKMTDSEVDDFIEKAYEILDSIS